MIKVFLGFYEGLLKMRILKFFKFGINLFRYSFSFGNGCLEVFFGVFIDMVERSIFQLLIFGSG